MRRPRLLLCFLVWSVLVLTLRVLAAPAWTKPGVLAFTDEDVANSAEGIHAEAGASEEQRRLLIAPPGALTAEAVRATLPRRGAKLGDEEPFTILAIGDSVTATGPYPEILAKLLGRATGHADIRVKRAAYPGCSVDAGHDLQAVWKANADGTDFTAELFIPYAVAGLAAWPESGDLGFSLVWRHRHEDGRATYLMWAENGHPWNPRWFGVVRRDPKGPVAFRVRVQ